jgi:hypothetical protein
MSLRIEPTTPQDQAALIQFLITIFHANSGAPFVKPELIHWKYFEPLEGWNGPRSFILKQGSNIVAHAGIIPLSFITQNREVSGIHLIDWAASPSVPGAGVLLLRKAASLTETILAVGGSTDTRQIMPKLGFKEVATLELFARVVRPSAQVSKKAFRSWKAPARLARNYFWSLAPKPRADAGWSASKIAQFDRSMLLPLQNGLTAELTTCKRTAEMLNYMLRCPEGYFSAFSINKAERLIGHFVLSWIGRQCRIADLLVDSILPSDWRSAYALATSAAIENTQTCEIVASASVPLARGAILHNGFHPRDNQPIFLSDPKRRLSGLSSFNIALLDGEGSYLNDPAHPFLT